MCESDRVLIIDAKGDDPVWERYGLPVGEIPADPASGSARDFWYRLVADRDPKTARAQIARALDTVAAEGHFVVVVDEVRALTDTRPPALGLRAELDQISVLGGSRNISLIAGTQETQWMPSTPATCPRSPRPTGPPSAPWPPSAAARPDGRPHPPDAWQGRQPRAAAPAARRPRRSPRRSRLPMSSLTNSGKPSGRCCPHPARPTGPTSGPTCGPSSPELCARKSSASPAATSRPHSEPTARPYAPAYDAGRQTPPGQPSATSWTTPPTCGSSPHPGQPDTPPGPRPPRRTYTRPVKRQDGGGGRMPG